MAIETGIDKEMIEKILRRFEDEKKVIYQNNWVGVKNFIKHQSLNPKVERGIEICIGKAPKEILDRLCIAYDSLSHTNTNTNTNSNKIGYQDSLSRTNDKKTKTMTLLTNEQVRKNRKELARLKKELVEKKVL